MNVRVLGVLVLTGAVCTVLSVLIWNIFGPKVKIGIEPRFSFLKGHEPVRRIPSINGWSACTVYSFPSSLSGLSLAIEKEMPDHFEHVVKEDHLHSWSAAKDNSGVEISVYPRREWIDEQRNDLQESRKDWVTVYVYYPAVKKAPPSTKQYSIVGKWMPILENKPWRSTNEYFLDGTTLQTTVYSNRNRRSVAKGKWRVEDGWLIIQSLRTTTVTDGVSSTTGVAPFWRTPLKWNSPDEFELGDTKIRWVRAGK